MLNYVILRVLCPWKWLAQKRGKQLVPTARRSESRVKLDHIQLGSTGSRGPIPTCSSHLIYDLGNPHCTLVSSYWRASVDPAPTFLDKDADTDSHLELRAWDRTFCEDKVLRQRASMSEKVPAL
jgi:hypothetical protein